MELMTAILAAFVIHEGGHWVAARFFGKRLRFRRKGFRLVWDMPFFFERWKPKVIAVAGFGAEFLVAGSLLAAWPEFGRWYAGVALTHFVAYRFYAGEESDFRWL